MKCLGLKNREIFRERLQKRLFNERRKKSILYDSNEESDIKMS